MKVNCKLFPFPALYQVTLKELTSLSLCSGKMNNHFLDKKGNKRKTGKGARHLWIILAAKMTS